MKPLSALGNFFREVKSGFASIADTEANLDGVRQQHIRAVVASVRELLPTGELPVDALEKMISEHRRRFQRTPNTELSTAFHNS